MKHDYDLVIIGAGSAGMMAAELATEMGVRVALAERDRIGGDCLWTGCVPSKTLLASAKAAYNLRHADRYGLPVAGDGFDTAPVWERIRRTQREIAETDDSPERFQRLGVDLLWGEASFQGEQRVRVGARTVSTRYALLCTGSRPAIPPIDGLLESDCLTSESVFSLERAPASIVVVGAGPVGVELSQAMNRLGVRTTLVEQAERILVQEEFSLAEALLARLRDEGVAVHLGVELTRAEVKDRRKVLCGKENGEERRFAADAVLVATGRMANIDSLGLESVGVRSEREGVIVDDRMKTSAGWVYAAGDCAGRYLFSHSAASEAFIALRNMFFPGSMPASKLVPRATFTDPELAGVGMTSVEARGRLGEGRVRVFEQNLAHSDRARAEGATEGRVVVVTDSKLRVLGAHVLAPGAGDAIGQMTLAIDRGLKLTPELARVVQVYPTFSTSVSRIVAEAIYSQLQSPFLRALRRLYGRLSR